MESGSETHTQSTLDPHPPQQNEKTKATNPLNLLHIKRKYIDLEEGQEKLKIKIKDNALQDQNNKHKVSERQRQRDRGREKRTMQIDR